MLSQLVYSSARGELGPGGISRLVERARVKNAERNLTGAILLNRYYFLQCLEGDRKDVTEAFCLIRQDPRHSNVEIMSVTDIAARAFPDWTMGLLAPIGAMTPILRKYLPTEDLSPQLLAGESAVALLRDLRDAQHTV